jgi:uncharacterized protein YkwD
MSTAALWTILLAMSATSLAAWPALADSGCPDGDLSASGGEPARGADALLCEMNEQRADAGLAPLRESAQLDRSAAFHAHDMAAYGYFAHQRSGEPALMGRIRATGYFSGIRRALYTENLADAPVTSDTASIVVDAWMHSAEHRRNLLTEPYRDAGIAIASVPAEPAFYPDVASTLFVVDYGRRYPRARSRCTLRSGHRRCARRTA